MLMGGLLQGTNCFYTTVLEHAALQTFQFPGAPLVSLKVEITSQASIQRIMLIGRLGERSIVLYPRSDWCPPCRAARQPRVTAIVTASYTTKEASTSQQARRDEAVRRAQELPPLLQEIAQTAIANGPTGAVRCTLT